MMTRDSSPSTKKDDMSTFQVGGSLSIRKSIVKKQSVLADNEQIDFDKPKHEETLPSCFARRSVQRVHD